MNTFPSILALQGVPYQVETAVAMLLLTLAIVAGIRLGKHPFWGSRLRELRRMKFAMLCTTITGIFLVIAWLDAISWKDNIDRTKGDIPLEAAEPRSLFERAFSGVIRMPEYEYRESSYSVPLATNEFSDKSIKLKHRHLLGTTKTGYDSLFLIMKGIKPAVVIGTLPLLVAIPLALMFGVTAGFFGGKTDDIVVYLYTTFASIPSLLLLIALISVIGQGFLQIAVGLGVTSWIGLCRLVRGETFKLREMEYVQAARCLGVPGHKIIFRHVVPNLMHIVIITAILAFGGLVVAEAVLAYLGIGLDFSWGGIIDNARAELAREPVVWWNFVFVTTFFFVLILSVNVVGDALRDVLDPKTSAG
jgi:peptide/nickel transport system permease protein